MSSQEKKFDVATKQLPKHETECALDVLSDNVSKDQAVCSSKEMLNEYKKLADTKGISTADVKTPRDIVEKAKQATQCKTEKCVAENRELRNFANPSLVKDNLKNFKVKGPANSTELLNNFNIDNTLKRLTKPHKRFYPMKFQMIDFAGVKNINGEYRKGFEPTELGKLYVPDLIKKGYTSMGVVLNTDVRTGRGIHWFALFFNFATNPITLEHFNSSGRRSVARVRELLERCASDIKTSDMFSGSSTKKVVIIDDPSIVHQKHDTECGMYSIYYIWNRLNNVDHRKFREKTIPDKMMEEFRRHVFSQD